VRNVSLNKKNTQKMGSKAITGRARRDPAFCVLGGHANEELLQG
jgi:hypothetical protein